MWVALSAFSQSSFGSDSREAELTERRHRAECQAWCSGSTWALATGETDHLLPDLSSQKMEAILPEREVGSKNPIL